MATVNKLRMSARAARIMANVDHYIRQYDIKGNRLSDAASDELDGAVTRDEVDELVRRRLLRIVKFDNKCGQSEACGSNWTVAQTDRAMTKLWPERMAPSQKES